jgi:hypothetical protein
MWRILENELNGTRRQALNQILGRTGHHRSHDGEQIVSVRCFQLLSAISMAARRDRSIWFDRFRACKAPNVGMIVGPGRQSANHSL